MKMNAIAEASKTKPKQSQSNPISNFLLGISANTGFLPKFCYDDVRTEKIKETLYV